MKKKIILLLFLIYFIHIDNVSASSLIKITSSNEYIYYNEEFKIDIGAATNTEINNIDGQLEYDKTKLELVEIDTYKGIECAFNDQISCMRKKTTSNNNLFYIIFKPKSTLKVNQNVIISFKNIIINEGEVSQKDISKTFKVLKDNINTNTTLKLLTVNGTNVLDNTTYTTTNESIIISGETDSNNTNIIGLGNKKLKVGENIFNIVTESESGLKKAYIIKVYKKELPSKKYEQEIKEAEEKTNYYNKNNNIKSTDNKNDREKQTSEQPLLKNITITNQKLNFDPYKFIYKIKVESDVKKLDIKAYADKDIEISIEKDDELSFGENIIIINLKKGDNTNKYVLYVTRKEVVEDDSNTFEEKFKTDEESNIINKTIIYAFIVIIAFTIIIIGFIKIKDKNRKK